MTLSQTAVLTKQAIILAIILLVLGIASFIGYRVWYAYYLAHLPPKVPVADTKFGVLPAPDFPKSDVSSSNYTYSIDTTTGNLPKLGVDAGFDKIIKVYFISKVYATLLSSEKSNNLAEKFGIRTNPQVLSETSYLYKDGAKTLSVDLDTGNFTYTKEATVSAKEIAGDENKLIDDFKNLLSTFSLLKDELKTGSSKVIFSKEEGTAQISLWPTAIDKKPILTSDFNKSLVNAVIFKNASNLDNYLSLNFTFWPVDPTTFATYPAKSPDEALNDLKNGKGVIIIQPSKAQVSITSNYIAYFMPESYSPYLQPIYVFEGPQFVAYVPVITEQFQSQAR